MIISSNQIKLKGVNVSFEVTRRCNMLCSDYCMRGESQNLDLDKSIVDAFFDKNNFIFIGTILFSGGEPTLNPEIIKYISDKIIENKIEISTFEMVSNGKTFSNEILDVFEEQYNYQKSINNRKTYIGSYSDFANISLSNDKFHEEMDYNNLINKYTSRGVVPTLKDNVANNKLIKSGLSNDGKENLSKKEPIIVKNGQIGFVSSLYINCKGFVIAGGDGSYDNMDNELHFSNVYDEKLVDALNIKVSEINYIMLKTRIICSLMKNEMTRSLYIKQFKKRLTK